MHSPRHELPSPLLGTPFQLFFSPRSGCSALRPHLDFPVCFGQEQEQLLLATSILIRLTTKTSACSGAARDPPYASPRSSGSRVNCLGAMASPPPLPLGCVSCVMAAIGAAKVRDWRSLLANLQAAVNRSVKKEYLREKEVPKGDGSNKFESKELHEAFR